MLCRLCHQALHPPFYGIAAMLTAATSADKRCKPNSTGPTVSFFKIKPCDKNIWKIINHHNHHGTIRTSLSISCVINCTNPLIGDSETIYQIWPSKEDLHDDKNQTQKMEKFLLSWKNRNEWLIMRFHLKDITCLCLVLKYKRVGWYVSNSQ